MVTAGQPVDGGGRPRGMSVTVGSGLKQWQLTGGNLSLAVCSRCILSAVGDTLWHVIPIVASLTEGGQVLSLVVLWPVIEMRDSQHHLGACLWMGQGMACAAPLAAPLCLCSDSQ